MTAQSNGARLRILVTSGATREPIDPVRFITNHSSGRTGAALSDFFARRGASVLHLGSRGSVRPELARWQEYATLEDLDTALRAALAPSTSDPSDPPFDAVIHAAAIADYRVASGPLAHKIDSEQPLTLTFERTPKLISRLRAYAAPHPIRVVGFKLTAGASPAEIEIACARLLANADWVVHNRFEDLSDITVLAAQRPFDIWSRKDQSPERAPGLDALGNALWTRLETTDAPRSRRRQ